MSIDPRTINQQLTMHKQCSICVTYGYISITNIILFLEQLILGANAGSAARVQAVAIFGCSKQ